MRNARILPVALGAVLALGAGACGSDGDGGDGGGDDFAAQSASEIKKAAIEAMADLDSMHVAGNATTESGAELELDVSADVDGNCTGQISQGGGTAEFIGADGVTYLKADDTLWNGLVGEAAPQVIALVGDKWAKLPPKAASGFEDFCDLDSLLEGFNDENDSEVTKGEVTEVDGEAAVVLEGTTDAGDKSMVYVATEGDHHVLKVEGVGTSSPGSFRFDEFDEDVDAQAPEDDEVVDLAQLEG